MRAFKFIPAENTLTAEAIRVLRATVPMSIDELKRHASDRTPVLQFVIFDRAWDGAEERIEKLLSEIESGALPLEVHAVEDETKTSPGDRRLSPSGLREELSRLHRVDRDLWMLDQFEEMMGLSEDEAPPRGRESS